MGNVAAYRRAWIRAQRYQADWDPHNKAVKDAVVAADSDNSGALVASALLTNTPPRRNLEMDTLADALRGDILVHMHCYRADEMLTILDMAKEFGYRVGTFHHGVEAFKIGDELAENDVCGALWAEWWGFTIEAYDGMQENMALVDRPAGGCVIVHSDSDDEGIQRLNQEAAKATLQGNRAGLDILAEGAIRWIGFNAAKSLGVYEQTGSIESGNMADVVLWNQDLFSIYAKPLQVHIDGVLHREQNNPSLSPQSDFELGQLMGTAQ